MKFFKYNEFNCSCCGKNSGRENMNKEFLEFLDLLRSKCKFPFRVTSGFRCKNKQQQLIDDPRYTASKNSSHCLGLAADIAISDNRKRALFIGYAMEITSEIDLPFRCGISGKQGFIHIDVDTKKASPRLWVY